MPELLVEIFSEEIPARMQLRATKDLYEIVRQGLLEHSLIKDGEIEVYCTPRRLVFRADLGSETSSGASRLKGPSADAAEAAVQGFFSKYKSQPSHIKVEFDKEVSERGTFWFVSMTHESQKTETLLPSLVQQIIQNFPWPKSMKWGAGTQTWVRPLHAVNVIFDGKVIMGNGEFYGHRFLSPKPFKANSFDKYKSELKNHHVILDQRERRAEIKAQSEKLAAQQKLNLKTDEAFDKLLDEVTGLVEWPVAMLGSFEKEYLDVPQECLIATMRANQKYFPLFDSARKLANHFVLIANVPGSAGQGPIVHGNERVLRARLSDAKFFYEQDLKTKLESRVEKLKTIQFHEKLGTLYDKTQRIMEISKKLAAVLKADTKLAARAAQLCKADLVTGMVGEFPELQGIMGRYYAEADGEPEDVYNAIRDHYQPLGPTATVPKTLIGSVVALADKLDTLSEFFRIGEKPTGSKDPYALRRAALGVIRIIGENSFRVPLSQFVKKDILSFILDRYQYYLQDEKNMRQDVCKAIINSGDDLWLMQAKAINLATFIGSPSGLAVLNLTKRASNILKIEEKKDAVIYAGKVDVGLFENDQEKNLYRALCESEEQIASDLMAEQYISVIAHLGELKSPLDVFFEKTLVNDSDPKIRANRLNLLGQIRSVFHQFADFSQLEG